MKTKILLAGLALSFIVAVPNARAAEPACRLEKELHDLKALKANPGPDASQQVKAELVVRKEILRKIIDCSISEAKSVQASLTAISPDDDEIRDLQREFESQLKGTIEHYASQRTKINDLGIRGSQNLSRALKDWRNSNYSELAEKTISFIIWMKNQALFKNAENRLRQIGQTITTLNLIDNDEVRAAYEKAAVSLSEAKKLNEATKQAFKLFDLERNTLVTTKQSLEALSDTYARFFELSEAVNKIIPQSK